jgi:hypothetical protein
LTDAARQAYAELTAALRDRVGHQTEEPNGRQDRRNAPENGEQLADRIFAGQRRREPNRPQPAG